MMELKMSPVVSSAFVRSGTSEEPVAATCADPSTLRTFEKERGSSFDSFESLRGLRLRQTSACRQCGPTVIDARRPVVMAQ